MNKKTSLIIILSIITGILIISIIVINNIKTNKGTDDILIGEENKSNKENESILLNKNDDNDTYSVIYNQEDYKDLPINYISASYAYDTSTPEKTTGVADYSFIAKINGILRTEYRYPSQVVRDGEEVTVYDPYTVYSVDVIENIKGEITQNTSIEIVLHGGISEDGKSYVFMEGMEFLNVGEYYILLPYTASDGRLGISNKTSIVSLGLLTESEIATFKEMDELDNSSNELSTDNAEDRKNGKINTVETYVKASKNPVVPECKQDTKSQLYDASLNN